MSKKKSEKMPEKEHVHGVGEKEQRGSTNISKNRLKNRVAMGNGLRKWLQELF